MSYIFAGLRWLFLNRVVAAIIFAALTVVPPYGLMWLAFNYGASFPLATLFVAMLWVVIAALLLPLNVKQVQLVAAASNVVMIGVVTAWIFINGWNASMADWMWWLYGAVAVGLLLGIQMLIPQVYRRMRGLTPVDTGHGHHADNHANDS